MKTWHWVWLGLLSLLVVACDGDGSTPQDEDTQPHDTLSDSATDAGSDSGPEPSDSGTASSSGTGSDVGTGSETGTGSDTGTGSETSTGSDTGTETLSQTESDTGTGSNEPFMTTWEYDFMVPGNGDAVLESDWFFEGGNTGEYTQGFWLNQSTIAAPVFFTGDFTAEIEFFAKTMPDDYIFRFAFRLVDPSWASSSARRFSGLAVYYTASPSHDDHYYQVDQGNGDYSGTDTFGAPPGLSLDQACVCKIVKTGDNVSYYFDDHLVRSQTVEAANLPVLGYAPMVHGHSSTDPADANFYVRKITVTHMSDEIISQSWN